MILLRLGKKSTLFIGLPVSSSPSLMMMWAELRFVNRSYAKLMKNVEWSLNRGKSVIIAAVIIVAAVIMLNHVFVFIYQCIYFPGQFFFYISLHLIFQQLFIPVMIVLVSVSENFPVYMIMCILVGTSVATLFLLPWCVTPKLRAAYFSRVYSFLFNQGSVPLNSIVHVHHLPLLFGSC